MYWKTKEEEGKKKNTEQLMYITGVFYSIRK